MKASICIVSVVVLTLGSTPILRAERQAPKAGGTIPNPHHHAKGEDVLREVAPEIKVVESSMPQNAEMQNLVLNKSKKFSSFTVTTEEGLETDLCKTSDHPQPQRETLRNPGSGMAQPPVERPGLGRRLFHLRSLEQPTCCNPLCL